MPVRIMLVDDHAILRQGLRAILETDDEFAVTAEAPDGETALRLLLSEKPDIVLVDISLPGISGLELVSRIRQLAPGVGMIILSMHTNPELVRRAVESGALGYLSKATVSDELITAIRTVHAGKRYFERGIADALVDALMPARDGTRTLNPLERLTPREAEVARMVATGRTSSEIGKRLNLSPKTVDTYRSRLRSKLGVANTADLVRFMLENKFAH